MPDFVTALSIHIVKRREARSNYRPHTATCIPLRAIRVCRSHLSALRSFDDIRPPFRMPVQPAMTSCRVTGATWQRTRISRASNCTHVRTNVETVHFIRSRRLAEPRQRKQKCQMLGKGRTRHRHHTSQTGSSCDLGTAPVGLQYESP